MKNLNISIANKVATYHQRDGAIICDNPGYIINFTFDSEWEGHDTKTARFKWNGGHFDIDFSGNQVEAPVIENAERVEVGVYVDDICTTTPAVIPCEKSILSGAPREFIPQAEGVEMGGRISQVEQKVTDHEGRINQVAQKATNHEIRIATLEAGGSGGGGGSTPYYLHNLHITVGVWPDEWSIDYYSPYAHIYCKVLSKNSEPFTNMYDLIDLKDFLMDVRGSISLYDAPEGMYHHLWDIHHWTGTELRVDYMDDIHGVNYHTFKFTQHDVCKITDTVREV